MKKNLIFLISWIFLFGVFQIQGFVHYDNSFARVLYRQFLVEDQRPDASELGRQILQNQGKNFRTEFRFMRTADKDYFFFINERQGQFLPYHTGSFVIQKNRQGELEQIKIFFLNDPRSFFRLEKRESQRVEITMSLFGHQPLRSFLVSHQLEDLIFFDLEDLAEIFSSHFNQKLWNFPYDYRQNQVGDMVETLRQQLVLYKDLPEVFDGGMDSLGRMVTIEDGFLQTGKSGFNCSGFAKWIADGIFRVQKGTLIPLSQLKEKHLDFRGSKSTLVYEDSHDPFFGLDWTRNIARVLHDTPQAPPETYDVRNIPYLKYIEDRGYPIENLEYALFLATQIYPGRIYFASFSGIRHNSEGRGLLLHSHVAVLFPWIDDGTFRLSVMEINGESSLESLKKRYRDFYVHLSYVDAFPSISLPEVTR